MTLVLADLKTHLNIDLSDTSQDSELQGFLDAAIDVAEGIVGPITVRSFTETHYGHAGGPLFLFRTPVESVESVANGYGPYSLVGLTADTSMGAVRSASSYGLRGDVTVTYTAGRATIPAAVRLAVLIIAAHLWETQRGAAPLPFGVNDVDAPTPGLGYAIPRRAEELLAPFATGPVLA
jgi:hypothetical protein